MYSDNSRPDPIPLRDILLAHLNGHYQGDATGEAFRRSGKTDIRIEDGIRAAFVAECRVWNGQKELSQAIDQLLGYLTWRDCKAAIIIFNKHNSKFSGLGLGSDQGNYLRWCVNCCKMGLFSGLGCCF